MVTLLRVVDKKPRAGECRAGLQRGEPPEAEGGVCLQDREVLLVSAGGATTIGSRC
jgi:hypothetical protein